MSENRYLSAVVGPPSLLTQDIHDYVLRVIAQKIARGAQVNPRV